jgi:glycogen operon protein
MKRNVLATLAFSQGVPMLSHGDELGRTQSGNNNAYCQDNELSWVDWDLDESRRELLEFTRRVLRIRADNPVLRRRTFFRHLDLNAGRGRDLTWLNPEGHAMTEADWAQAHHHVLGMLVRGRATDELDDRGRTFVGDTILLLLNGGSRSRGFTLPRITQRGHWVELVNTGLHGTRTPRGTVPVAAHSLVLLGFREDR